MKLNIVHTTTYAYPASVVDSVNELRLTPVTNDHQACFAHRIVTEPMASLFPYTDYYGNHVHAFSVIDAHEQLMIRTEMVVVTHGVVQAHTIEQAESKEAWTVTKSSAYQHEYAEFLAFTAYTTLPDVHVPLRIERETIYGWLLELNAQIQSRFTYDPSATNVHTTVEEMLSSHRGVCQDFAHLMIAMCRVHGIPARYVSGYHFIGDLQGGNADYEQATHAWMEAHIPGYGWCGFDPTNNEQIGERYVKLAHGRDYSDIVPVKGVYRGSAQSILTVAVDVRKMEAS